MRDFIDFSTFGWVFPDRNQAGQELLHVSNEHNAGEEGKGSSDLILDEDWRNVLATSSNDKLFGSACNEQHSVFGYLSVVSRVQISVAVDCLGCFLWILVVSHEDISASVADLA